MRCGATVGGELSRIPLGALHMPCTRSTDTTPPFLILQKPLGTAPPVVAVSNARGQAVDE
jgi:hypothetical protein